MAWEKKILVSNFKQPHLEGSLNQTVRSRKIHNLILHHVTVKMCRMGSADLDEQNSIWISLN